MSSPLSLLPIIMSSGCVSKQAVPTTAVENASQVAPTTAAPVQSTEEQTLSSGLGTKTAGTLLIYDSQISSDFTKSMQLYAQYTLEGAASEGIIGFDGLVSRLKEYSSIEQLVIFTHGIGGEIGLVESGATVFKSLETTTALFEGVAPRVICNLVIDGCNVGSKPSQMVHFKKLFQTPTISGWNYYHLLEPWPLPLTGTVSADAIRKKLEFPDDYLAPGAPDPVSFAGQEGTFYTLYEWFRDTYDATEPGLNPDRKTFVPRDDSRRLELTTSMASSMDVLEEFYLAEVTVRD